MPSKKLSSTKTESTIGSQITNLRLPPQNTEAEQAVLGSILIDQDCLVKIIELVKPSGFYQQNHQTIFQIMLRLFEKRKPIDVLTVSDELERDKKLDDIGGLSYLTTLANSTISSANIVTYAEIVKNNSILRQLIHAGSEIVNLGFKTAEDTNFLLDQAEQLVFSVSQQFLTQTFVPIKDILAETFERIELLHSEKGKLRGVSTGFPELDHITSGLQKSDLIIIAARPSMGKSSLALNIALQAAVKEKLTVGIFSLEMSKDQVIDRLIIAESAIDSWRYRTGNFEDDDFEKISQAFGILGDAAIFIDDSAMLNAMELRAKARRLQAEYGLGVLVVDYLQLMEGQRRSADVNRVQEISEISRSLKGVARELNVPVIALSQLSRAVEHRSPPIPQLADLRESGCLAADTLVINPTGGELINIADLVNRVDQHVLSLTEDLMVKPRPVIRAFTTGYKKVFRLKTRSGKLIKATANHQFYTIDGWKRLDQLAVGEAIATPRIIKYQPSASRSDDELGLLAHLIGDGCVLANQPIHYTSADLENLDYVEKAARALFNINPRRIKQENWYHSYLPSPYHLTHHKKHPITRWFEQLGIAYRRAGEKEIPAVIFKLPIGQIAYFLRHLWATDGSVVVDKDKQTVRIYYSSKSERLIRQLQYLLIRFGITGRIKSSTKSHYQPTWYVDIYGCKDQLVFIEKIGVYGRRSQKLNQAKQILSTKQANPNVDIIPKLIWATIEQARVAAGLTTRSFHTAMGWAYSGTQRHQNGLSLMRLEAITQVLPKQQLVELAQSDIFWDQIANIESGIIEPVYDLTVAEDHNFIANNIIVHNSLEQDSDLVIFIYREDYYRPDSERKNIADILIKKHRNGPTGEIELYFAPEHMRFRSIDRKRA